MAAGGARPPYLANDEACIESVRPTESGRGLTISPVEGFFETTRDHTAVSNTNDSVTGVADVILVGYQDYRKSLTCKTSKLLYHYVGVFLIELASGLVPQDERRVVDQGPGYGSALALPA